MTHPDTPLEPADRRREFWLLLTVSGIQFTHILDFMIMMPLGPQFTRLFGITDAQFGLLVSAYTLSAGVSGLAATLYVDRFDRKRLLLTLYSLFALATLACGLAPGYGFLMVARVAAGLFGGVLGALVQTIVADVVPFERRGRAMGMVMSAFSVATVAGVPTGLFLATRLGCEAPFLAIAALSGVLAVGAALTMPALRGHLGASGVASVWRGIAEVLKDRNHLRALGFSALMMCTGFTIIPFFTIYLEANVGLHETQIPYVYLCGGLATLFTARLIGRFSDRLGKERVYRWLALGVIPTILAMTWMPPLPIAAVLVVSTLLFVLLSGRMIPGMALITGAANPALRGTFMAFNSAVQSGAMGLASIVGGLIIGRDAAGQVTLYGWAGLVGVAASLLSLWVLRGLAVHSHAGVNRVTG